MVLWFFIWALFFGQPIVFGQNLRGRDFPCNKPDGEEIEIPKYITDTLTSVKIQCVCEKGVGQCRKITDKCLDGLKGCHFVQKSVTNSTTCDKECRPCHTKSEGIRYSGTSWPSEHTLSSRTHPSEGCEESRCFSGVVTRTRIQCATPMCPDPVLPTSGQCCPSCRGCSRAGQFFSEGESKPDLLDPCNECTCRKGHLECVKRACPVLPCSRNLVKTVKGQCCPICARSTELEIPEQKCLFRNTLYLPGQTIFVDVCTTCQCTDTGTIECKRQTCPDLKCPLRLQKRRRNDCCPKCLKEGGVADALPAVWAPPVQCSYEGAIYKEGHAWTSGCNQCTCIQGHASCVPMKCPALKCPPGTKKKTGKCCPTCEYEDGVCTVFGDPHYKTLDGQIFTFQGSCKYLLAQDCGSGDFHRGSGRGRNNSTFSVRITNDARDSLAFSWTRTITMRLHDLKISLLQKMRVKINGKKVSLPHIQLGKFSIMQDGYRIILRTADGKFLLFSEWSKRDVVGSH